MAAIAVLQPSIRACPRLGADCVAGLWFVTPFSDRPIRASESVGYRYGISTAFVLYRDVGNRRKFQTNEEKSLFLPILARVVRGDIVGATERQAQDFAQLIQVLRRQTEQIMQQRLLLFQDKTDAAE